MPDKPYAQFSEAQKVSARSRVAKRRKSLKAQAIELLGGSCWICSYKRCVAALEFHHLDPSQKDFALSTRGCTRSWEKVRTEVMKCALLCANCHREVHAGQATVPLRSVAQQ